jgi:aspartyl-tRNA(Asn)/glutamyl-tRNA(Gln) amidotransferase subunit B
VEFEPVIGLEVHAELETKSKMFCACPVVDLTQAQPNIAVCPVCSGMPGALPVINRKAVEYGLRVALALGCEISSLSLFARKNYFYPDLPKGYQISQYEQPLARNGHLALLTLQGERDIHIQRVHLEEDTGKLSHMNDEKEAYSLVDLNRAGIPLLEIVSEPDLRSAEEARAYAMSLRSLLRYLGVNSGDMQKGVMRVEPNVSVRLVGSHEFGIRTEIKNLNSFRALERSVDYEIRRQIGLLQRGGIIKQETRGWDENRGETILQRAKEEADDYRYFPEPDLPPLIVGNEWLERIRETLPELPIAKYCRFQSQYGLSAYDAGVLTAEFSVADYFEHVIRAVPGAAPKVVANWITGDLFGLLNQVGKSVEESHVTPQMLAGLIHMVVQGEINQKTAKNVLAEVFETGKPVDEIVSERGLIQISDTAVISNLVQRVLRENPDQVAAFLGGKEGVARWLFGQVMRAALGRANPQILKSELERQLLELNPNR